MDETCKDCRRYQNGRCAEEDEDGEICEKFERGETDESE
jgi:hypothetical protein